MLSHVNTAEIRPGNPISGLGVLLRNIEYDFDRVRPPPPLFGGSIMMQRSRCFKLSGT